MNNRCFNRNQTNILPKIKSNIEIINTVQKSNQLMKLNSNNFELSNKNLIINSLDKKPGTSIEKKKPLYILPKIPIKKLSNTANIKTNNINNINYYCKEFDYNENNNEINYENIGIDLLNNDDELKNMFEEIYPQKDNNFKKEWLNDYLFHKEVFKVILDSYIKNKENISSFIRKEINKILNNMVLDNVLAKSFKIIQFEYENYMNKLHNL